MPIGDEVLLEVEGVDPLTDQKLRLRLYDDGGVTVYAADSLTGLGSFHSEDASELFRVKVRELKDATWLKKSYPVKFTVLASETKHLPKGSYDFGEFEWRAGIAAEKNPPGEGYDKISYIVTFSDGDTYKGRLDLSQKGDKGFVSSMNSQKAYNPTEEFDKLWHDEWVKFMEGREFRPPQ